MGVEGENIGGVCLTPRLGPGQSPGRKRSSFGVFISELERAHLIATATNLTFLTLLLYIFCHIHNY